MAKRIDVNFESVDGSGTAREGWPDVESAVIYAQGRQRLADAHEGNPWGYTFRVVVSYDGGEARTVHQTRIGGGSR